LSIFEISSSESVILSENFTYDPDLAVDFFLDVGFDLDVVFRLGDFLAGIFSPFD
jgi:hypothetical protein